MSRAQKSLSVTVGGVYQWWADAVPLTWIAIAKGTGGGSFDGGQTPNQVRDPAVYTTYPAPSFAYSGGGVDQVRGEFMIYGGGHGGYQGNDVFAIRLRAAQPTWMRLNNNSPGVFTGGGGDRNGWGQYAIDIGVNDAPQASHSSRSIFARDHLWLTGLWGMQINSNRDVLGNVILNDTQSTSRVFAFNRTYRKWRAFEKLVPNEATTSYGAMSQGCTTIYVPVQDKLWTCMTAQLTDPLPLMYSINASTGQRVDTYDNHQTTGFSTAWGVTLGNGPYALFGCTNSNAFYYGGQGMYVMDMANPIIGFRPPKITFIDNTGISQADWLSEVSGAVYHAPSNAVFVYPRLGTEYIVKLSVPPNPQTDTWTAVKLTPANIGNPSRTIPVGNTYIYSKFNIVNDMGDGTSAFVLMPDNGSDGPTYVMKIPAGGI